MSLFSAGDSPGLHDPCQTWPIGSLRPGGMAGRSELPAGSRQGGEASVPSPSCLPLSMAPAVTGPVIGGAAVGHALVLVRSGWSSRHGTAGGQVAAQSPLLGSWPSWVLAGVGAWPGEVEGWLTRRETGWALLTSGKTPEYRILPLDWSPRDDMETPVVLSLLQLLCGSLASSSSGMTGGARPLQIASYTVGSVGCSRE